LATITKEIKVFGKPRLIGCDGRCDKAWGVNARPKVSLSQDPNDYAFLADDELGQAPDESGTSEGGFGKPSTPAERLNKWCYRECERCTAAEPGAPLPKHDFSRRLFNQPSKHPAESVQQNR
jgi:hypothetical protein